MKEQHIANGSTEYKLPPFLRIYSCLILRIIYIIHFKNIYMLHYTAFSLCVHNHCILVSLFVFVLRDGVIFGVHKLISF